MPTAKRSTRTLLFVAVWVVALGYTWTYLDRGWVPHDEGTLAFSAARVMDGMVPHLDYDEVYTGGLAFAGAAAFKVFGVDLFTLRLLLFVLFALWIPAVYWSARRFATPSLSVVVTLLAGAWSIPAYSAAVPSWFNLFFAGFAVACLLRHLETSGRRWLVAAGVAAGASILVKVVGLYLVAGCLLALALFEQAAPRRDPEPRGSGGRLYSGLVTAAGIALSLLVWSGGSRNRSCFCTSCCRPRCFRAGSWSPSGDCHPRLPVFGCGRWLDWSFPSSSVWRCRWWCSRSRTL